MKKIIFVTHSLGSGGAERALITLLNTIDYKKYSIDLLLLKKEGIFLKQLPKNINLLKQPKILKLLYKDINFFSLCSIKNLTITLFKIIIKIILSFTSYTEKEKLQIRWKYFYNKIINNYEQTYDIAIAWLQADSTYYVCDKIKAHKKIAWFHNDYKSATYNSTFDKVYYQKFDTVITVSEECLNALNDNFHSAGVQTKYIPNLNNTNTIIKLAGNKSPKEYDNKVLNILSIGRLVEQKGFDLAIEAANLLLQNGIKFKWFIIGIGKLEKNLLKKVKKLNLINNVFFLGEIENPYPYIKFCDIVVQTSRFEGKSIVLDEAKILCKPIVVTNYNTVRDQIEDDVNGKIVELSPEGIFEGIISCKDLDKRKKYINNLKKKKVDNTEFINQYYELFDN